MYSKSPERKGQGKHITLTVRAGMVKAEEGGRNQEQEAGVRTVFLREHALLELLSRFLRPLSQLPGSLSLAVL